MASGADAATTPGGRFLSDVWLRGGVRGRLRFFDTSNHHLGLTTTKCSRLRRKSGGQLS